MKKKFLIILLMLALILTGCNKKEETSKKKVEDNKVVEKQPVAPATDTEELITKTDNIEVTSVSTNTIEFKKDAKVEEGDKIAVWIYSKPKFLGYFNVVVENGVKKIEGLEEALEKAKIETGEHNIALVSEEGETIGHIDIYIDEEKEVLKEKPPVFTYKEVVETKEIAYKTTKKTNANMKKGTTKTVQKGSKGTKEITYKVKYDEEGKEVSREKISEKVTKEAVNEIIETGAAQFNLKTDKITGSTNGFVCKENQRTDEYGELSCNEMIEGLSMYNATIIGDVYIVTHINEVKVTKPFIITKAEGLLYKGTYNGETLYFDKRAGGGDDTPLTEEKCNELNITCGTW